MIPAAAAVLAIGIALAAQDPAEELKKILAEGRTAGFRDAQTDAERKAAVDRADALSVRIVDFAERHAASPIAVEAAVDAVNTMNGVDSLAVTAWAMNRADFPEGSAADPSARLIGLLLREHARREGIGTLCLRMSYGHRRAYAAFLREVEASNPSRDVRAIACLALAQHLNLRLLKLDQSRERPDWAPRFERLFGREDFDAMRGRERASALAEIEAAFEKAVATYGDAPHPYGGTIGDKAASELFEIRSLAVGKSAPEIEGVDQSGRPMKLSEFRGRVVLLDFWTEY